MMETKTITQFVGFTTDVEPGKFETLWKDCTLQFIPDAEESTLHKIDGTTRLGGCEYISQHRCSCENFRFDFLNAEHFPDHAATVTQMGGYMPVQIQCLHNTEQQDIKIIAFISYQEKDLGFYHRQTYRHLNIYEAYYENCTYSYIMEFFVQEPEGIVLVNQLKSRPGVGAAIYRECHTLCLEKAPG